MENQDSSIWLSLFICFGMVCVIKHISFKKRKSSKPVSFSYWLANNWADFPVQLFLSWLVFSFDNDVITFINWLVKEVFNREIEIPHVENNQFYFVLTPIALTWLSYKFLRKKVSDKAHAKTAPTLHDEFSEED